MIKRFGVWEASKVTDVTRKPLFEFLITEITYTFAIFSRIRFIMFKEIVLKNLRYI